MVKKKLYYLPERHSCAFAISDIRINNHTSAHQLRVGHMCLYLKEITHEEDLFPFFPRMRPFLSKQSKSSASKETAKTKKIKATGCVALLICWQQVCRWCRWSMVSCGSKVLCFAPSWYGRCCPVDVCVFCGVVLVFSLFGCVFVVFVVFGVFGFMVRINWR